MVLVMLKRRGQPIPFSSPRALVHHCQLPKLISLVQRAHHTLRKEVTTAIIITEAMYSNYSFHGNHQGGVAPTLPWILTLTDPRRMTYQESPLSP